MIYEYEFEAVPLPDEEARMLAMNLIGNIHVVNTAVKTVLDARSKLGWEPLYPFSVPVLWFRREVKTRKTKKN